MADIQLRFNHDMLVLSSPITTQLERIGVDSSRDNELTLLLEPEVFDELYGLESAAGAQCVVADTASLTPARLAHARMQDRGRELAETAVAVAGKHTPQHILAEIGPCGLPLDASSKASLVENRDQYARAAAFFSDVEPLFDAYFLNGFTDATDLKCALMGMRKVTDKPIFASVDVDASGALAKARAASRSESLEDAVSTMAEYGAQVVGFATDAAPDRAVELARRAKTVNPMLPVLVQLCVRTVDPEQKKPTEANPYPNPDTMVDAADALKPAGVQFLRAVGTATPSYTGALAAATLGDTVELDMPSTSDGFSPASEATRQRHPERSEAESRDPAATTQDPKLDALASQLRARINEALNN